MSRLSERAAAMWANPFAGSGPAARRATYLAALALLAASAALAVATRDYSRFLRAGVFLTIAVFDMIAARKIRGTTNYHPAYKIEKGGIFVVFVALAASLFVGISGVTLVTYAWIAIVFVTQFASFEFILRRNANPRQQLLHTTQGLVEMPETQAARDAILDVAASIIRHSNMYGEPVKVDPRMVEQLRDALNMPPQGSEAERAREWARQRRALAAQNAEIGIRIELSSYPEAAG